MKLKLLILVMIVAATAAILVRGVNFKIKEIDCQLNHYPCPLSLEPVLLSFIDKNIFELKAQSVERQLLSFDPTLTEISIDKYLPDRLRIDAVRRLPVARIKLVTDLVAEASVSAQVTDNNFYLDKSGFVYRPPVLLNQPLPEVWWPESLPLIEGESPLSLNLAQLIDTLAAYYVNFEQIVRLPEGVYLIITQAGLQALIPTDADFASRVASLQFILTNLKIGEASPKKIDLRFDKPVLTY